MNIFSLDLIKKIIDTPKGELFHKINRGINHYILNRPTVVVIQTVSACNLKCSHCFISNYGKEINDGDNKILKFDEFKKFADRLNKVIEYAEVVEFTTFEPFIQKNLFKMMDYILGINPKIKFPINTNAMAVTDEIIEQLAEYPISDFNISLDGVKKETVEKFKTDVKYDKIIDTIKKANQSKLNDKLGVVLVLHRDNIDELVEYIDFVNEMGVKNIFVNNLLAFTPDKRNMYLYSKEGNSKAEAIVDNAIEKVRRNKQTIWLPGFMPRKSGCTTCESLIVDINGNVSPCDFLAVSTPFELFGETKVSPPLIFGNIFDKEPMDIYNSKQFNEFRQKHRKGKSLPRQCTLCIDAYGLMCSNRTKYS